MPQTAIIIGAGVAGMSLAQKLSDEGISVTLIEATKSLGGHCRSIFDAHTKEFVDNGQHLMMGAYFEFLNFIDRLETKDSLSILQNLDIQFYNSLNENYRVFDNNISGKAGFAYAISKLKLLSNKEKMQFIKFVLKIKLMNPEDIKTTVSQFLIENKQSQNIVQLLWTPLTLAVLNSSPSEAPASLFVKVMQIAFLGSNEASKFIYCNSNYKELFEPLSDILKNNHSQILFNTPINEIKFSDNKAKGIVTKSGEFLTADYIISAVPFHQLLKLLPDEVVLNSPLKFLYYYTSNTIISSHLWYQEEIDLPIINAVVMSPIHWIFNRRKMNVKYANSNYKSCFSITISDANEMNDKSQNEIYEIITDELSMVNDIFSKYKPSYYRIFKDKRATFASTIKSEKVRISQKTQFDNFFICGDWTDTKYPATIEGAAVSASIVNDLILG